MKSSPLLVSLLLTALAPQLAAADVNQPVEIIDRSRTLPPSELELSAGLVLAHTPAGDMVAARTTTGLELGAGYGFTPALEARIGYGIGLDPSSGKGPLSLGAAYDLVRTPVLTAAVDAFGGYDLGAEDPLPLRVGVEAQLKLGAKLAVFTPGHQLSFGLAGKNPIGLHLPVGIGFQPTRQIFVDLQTEIAYLGFKEGGTRVFGADEIPLRVDAFYSITNAIDLGVWLADDLKRAGDVYQLGAIGRVFL